ncbi:5'-nucleotidase [Apostasia shenzhenica]|uniref:5'-nucleotidase n=1 Tax=Apostasia shenzhenica TaxID=1088818 RepID=A0A2I0A6U1_9ASPA|nr:5'-nucleotidase [Apostasia shenzhenica]
MQDAVDACLPLLCAAVRAAEKGTFLKECLLNIQIPASPSTRKMSDFDKGLLELFEKLEGKRSAASSVASLSKKKKDWIEEVILDVENAPPVPVLQRGPRMTSNGEGKGS